MRISAIAWRNSAIAIILGAVALPGCALKRAHDQNRTPIKTALSKTHQGLHQIVHHRQGARQGFAGQGFTHQGIVHHGMVRHANLAAPSVGFATAVQPAMGIQTEAFTDPLQTASVPPPHAPPMIFQSSAIPPSSDAWRRFGNSTLALLQSEALVLAARNGDLQSRLLQDEQLAGSAMSTRPTPNDTAELVLMRRIAFTFKDVRLYQQQLQALHNAVKSQQATVELTKRRFDEGKTGRMDTLQVESVVDTTKTQMSPVRNNLRAALNRLSALVGKPLTAAVIRSIAAEQQLVLPELNDRLPASVLRQRRDVRSAEHSLATIGSMQGIYEASLLPQLALQGELTAKQDEITDALESDSLGFDVGNQATWKFAESDAALSRSSSVGSPIRNALRNYESTVYSAANEVEILLTDYHRNLLEVRRLENAQAVAAESTHLTKQQVEADRLASSALVTSHTREVEIAGALATARAKLAETAIKLFIATGADSGLQPPHASFQQAQ